MPLSPRRRAQWSTLKGWIQVGVWGIVGWQVLNEWPDIQVRLHHLTTTDYLVAFGIGLGIAPWVILETKLRAIETELGSVNVADDIIIRELADQRALLETIETKLSATDAGLGLIIAELGESRDRLEASERSPRV